jgi:hypothetical protein
MNWFAIRIEDGKDRYTYAGSSSLSIEQLVEQAAQGKFIRLDDLFYGDRGVFRNWSEWESREIPMVHINPKVIISIHQYKSDPRKLRLHGSSNVAN